MEKDMKQHIPAEQLVWSPWEGEGGNVCPTWSQKDFHPAVRTPDNYVLCLWKTSTSEWCCSGSEISLSTGTLSGETSLPRHHPTAVVSFFKNISRQNFHFLTLLMPARPGRPYSLSLWWPPSSCLPPSCIRLLCNCCCVPGKTGSGSWRPQKIATLLWPCGPPGPGQWATCLTPSQGVTHTCWEADTRVSHNKTLSRLYFNHRISGFKIHPYCLWDYSQKSSNAAWL